MLELMDIWPKIPEELRSRLAEDECTAPFIMQGWELQELLLSEERADRIQESLTTWAEQTLRLVVSHFPGQSFRGEQLTVPAEQEGIPGAGVAAGLLELRRKGILFAFQKMWGENVYFVPTDIASIWYERLIAKVVPHDSSMDVKIISRSGIDAADALFGLLLAVTKEPVKLTKKETISKRQLDMLTAAIGLSKAEFDPLGLQYPNVLQDSPQLAVMLDFALRLGLLVQADRQFVAASDQADEWLKLSRKQMNRILKRLWDTGYMPSMISGRCAALILHRLREGSWYSTAALMEALNQDENELKAAVLAPLMALGWLQLGRTEQGDRVFQLLNDRSAVSAEHIDNGKWFVQPDFEIICPPDVPFSARWELERFAERIRLEQVSIYKLTKSSVTAGLRSGGKLECLLGLLDTSSRYGIPDNVSSTIADWGRREGKITVCEAVLLRCQNEETADEIASNPSLNSCLGSRLGSCHFLVLSDRLENLILVVNEHGYPVSHPRVNEGKGIRLVQSSGSKDEPSFNEKGMPPLSENRFLFIDNACLLFEAAGLWPKPEELFPQLRAIPSVWLKDCRAYHGSTTRQLIQTAIEWKALVRLKAGNRDRLVTPKRIEESASGWSLLAAEKAEFITLRQDEWEEMQLIVPGINDKK